MTSELYNYIEQPSYKTMSTFFLPDIILVCPWVYGMYQIVGRENSS